MIATIILGVLALVVLAAWLYREHRHDAERHELLDRIQAPWVAQMAAQERVLPHVPAEPEPEQYTEPVPPGRHDDLALQALLGED